MAANKDPRIVDPEAVPQKSQFKAPLPNADIECDLKTDFEEPPTGGLNLSEIQELMDELPVEYDRSNAKSAVSRISGIEAVRTDLITKGFEEGARALSTLVGIAVGGEGIAPSLREVTDAAAEQVDSATKAMAAREKVYEGLIAVAKGGHEKIQKLKNEYNAAVHSQPEPKPDSFKVNIILDESTGAFKSYKGDNEKFNAVLTENLRYQICRLDGSMEDGHRKLAALDAIKTRIAAFGISKIQAARQRLILADAFYGGYQNGLNLCLQGVSKSLQHADESAGTIKQTISALSTAPSAQSPPSPPPTPQPPPQRK